MTINEEKSKKPLFQRRREKVSKKWKSFLNYVPAIKGIIVIILIGVLACSPILVFSSIKFLTSIPIFYKILAFLLFSGLFLYYYFKWTFKYISEHSKTLKTYYGWEDGIAVLLLIYGIYSFLMHPTLGFLEEFRAELIGAGIATLLIGNASQAAQIQEEKRRLILQMGSPDNGFALEAVRQLWQHGWLQDGSLRGANLYKAGLSGADLGRADLRGACLDLVDLSGAFMEKADLSGAEMLGTNLSKTNLSEVNFSGARLYMVNLRGAKFYDEFSPHPGTFDETTEWSDSFYSEGEDGTVFPTGFDPIKHGMHLIKKNESNEDAFKRVFPERYPALSKFFEHLF